MTCAVSSAVVGTVKKRKVNAVIIVRTIDRFTSLMDKKYNLPIKRLGLQTY
jgi:hypothetical protein